MAFIANRKTSSFLVSICFSVFSSHTTTEACHRTDRTALLDFKSMISKDLYGALLTWNQSTDCCIKWEGVKCDPNGRVVNLTRGGMLAEDSPRGRFMEGTISPSLGKLKFLRVLDLSFQQKLRAVIPRELGKLSHLTTLFLNDNQLSGSIPASFQNFRKLDQLYLQDNFLSGTVPPNVFQHMLSLTELRLSSNQLSGQIPSSIRKLISLKRLHVDHNNFSGSIPSTIGYLKNLVSLDLSSNQISGSIPSTISKLIALDSCILSDNKLTNSIPASISKTRLQFLDLDNNMLSGKLPKGLENLTNLNYFSAKNNRLTGKIPSSFSNLISLQILDLSQNGLSGPIPSELAKLNATLHTLDLSFNPLSLVTVPSWITKMKLQRLSLARTGLIGELLESLLSMNNFLFYLDLSSNMLAGKLPTWIGRMTNLVSLDISNNNFHSDIPTEFKNLLTLRELDLHSNNFTGGLSSIFAKAMGGVFGPQSYTFIDLSYNVFTGRIDNNIGHLEVMEFIDTLVISNNHLGGSLPNSIGKLSQLRILKLAKNRFIGNIPAEVINLASLVEFGKKFSSRTVGEPLI